MRLLNFNEIFNVMKYPAGEPHVRIGEMVTSHDLVCDAIIFQVRDWNDLMILTLADDILKTLGLSPRWVVPYFPFARHDRKINARDSRPLEFAIAGVRHLDLLVIDPHSDITGMLNHVPQADVVRQFRLCGLEEASAIYGDIIYAIPDAGASKKAGSWLAGKNSVQCLKKRDMATGKLSGFQVVDGDKITGKRVIIVDDICDGGGTFLGLAEELNRYEPAGLTLAITHGLFTKGNEGLQALNDAGYNEIWTLDIYRPTRAIHYNVFDVPLRSIVQDHIEKGTYIQ